MSQKWVRIIVALGIGCAMIHFGGRLLGVRVELFWGLSTFSLAWIANIFLVPFVTGWVIAWVYGMGGKMVAHFPPLIVHTISYFETVYSLGVPHGASLNPIGFWGLYVILTMEFCALGAFLGEFHIQRAVVKRRKKMKEMQQAETKHESNGHGA
ncbi:MAG: hypothetical protein BMS9Abin18_0123 [Zetaproteobacteria bacterium]|nr:MAG: hypothetical protein BMS9Abin18_0123 [Zetaproteobacteria bacterium]